MSKLSEQCDELRKMAAAMSERGSAIGLDYGMGRGLVDAARMMREAADTIENMRDRLQRAEEDARIIEVETSHIDIEQGEVITRFIPAELDYIEDKSRWHELFGTPERAARTLAGIVTADGCVDCALLDATCCRNKDAWLGWLRGDAE